MQDLFEARRAAAECRRLALQRADKSDKRVLQEALTGSAASLWLPPAFLVSFLRLDQMFSNLLLMMRLRLKTTLFASRAS